MRANDTVRVDTNALHRFCAEVLCCAGVASPDANVVADCMLESELRGIAGHGVSRLPSYLRRIQKGGCNPRPDIRIVLDTPSTTLLDGDGGFGELAGTKAMELAIEKARSQGVGTTVVRNSSSFGAAANFPIIAVRQDMIGFTTLSTVPMIAPPGGLKPSIGNSPLAFGIPAGREHPILLDMALTTASRGKCRAAVMEERKIPLDWAVTKDGQPTDDPAKAIEGLFLPIANYKGYGLGIIMGCLTGVLSGGQFGLEIQGAYDPTKVPGISHFHLALSVATFMPMEEFKVRVDQLIRQQKTMPLAKGSGPVYMPGEIEWLRKEECLRDGIPLSKPLLSELQLLGEESGIASITH